MLASRALRVVVLGAAFAVASSVGAVIDGLSSDVTTMQSFKSKLQPGVGLRFVRNSGVCETTPGVNQLSGYVDFAPNSSMWFWFFEARQSPETAPLTLWLNGGPGCSSMIGLFQENGPCHVNEDGVTTTLNPFSWNNISNVLYIDQPIGTGFSHGTVTVNSTFTAAPAFWQAFQVLKESGQLDRYTSKEFIFATESYGGHYGPEFVTVFDEQNTKIDKGLIQGEKIEVTALMINNGWYDPLIQNQAYVDFATNAPGYGQLQSDAVIASLNKAFFGAGGCQEQEMACYAAGNSTQSNTICRQADNFCVENVFVPAVGDRDSDDLRQTSPASFPSESYVQFLRNATTTARIGAEARYTECSNTAGAPFSRTGDDARTLLPQLSALVNSGLKTLIWAGDADINCNWLGGHASVLAMDWFGNETLHNTPFTNITIRGEPVAAVQNVANFSFARVFQSGHEVPAFQPEAAFAIFSQVLNGEPLHSV